MKLRTGLFIGTSLLALALVANLAQARATSLGDDKDGGGSIALGDDKDGGGSIALADDKDGGSITLADDKDGG